MQNKSAAVDKNATLFYLFCMRLTQPKDIFMKHLLGFISSVSIILVAIKAQSAEGYLTHISCISQTETAKITAEFKTILGSYKRASLTIAKINSAEFRLDEVPTVGPLVLALKSVTTKQAEIPLKNLVINKNEEELSVQTLAGIEQININCKISISENLKY